MSEAAAAASLSIPLVFVTAAAVALFDVVALAR
jgi:hypothetical protein